MDNDIQKQHWDTVVIGAGQAGLAAGYYLAQHGADFVILNADTRVGDSWRRRWDSLQLFTPSQHDDLPGMAFPAPKWSFPTKDEVADYLESYAERFNLPVRQNVRATSLKNTDGEFEIGSSDGTLTANRVVVATGTQPVPKIPAFARDLDPGIHQIHSSEYKNPESLPAGDTLVVGAGISGVELAYELAPTRKTILSGKPTMHVPDAVLKYFGESYWWIACNVVTVRTPIGRKAQHKYRSHGAPLVRISAKDAQEAGAECVPRVAGVSDGKPQLEDGRVLDVSNVLWCTGFKPDFSWIDLDVFDEKGWPRTDRGVTNVPGLYFAGMLFQYGLTSGLVGGVGRDVDYIVGQMYQAKAA